MDHGDISAETAEFELQAQIQIQLAKSRIPRFPFIGKCYNCEAPVLQGSFCDLECCNEYQELQAKLQRR